MLYDHLNTQDKKLSKEVRIRCFARQDENASNAMKHSLWRFYVEITTLCRKGVKIATSCLGWEILSNYIKYQWNEETKSQF